MTLREQIVTEALTWWHTPYRDGQRCKGAGTDCIQFIAGVVENIGLIPKVETPYYSPQWHLHQSEELLLKNLDYFGCKEKSLEEKLPGDILVFRFGLACSHCAIYLPNDKIIHALINRREVVIHRLLGDWKNTWLKKCFVLPGVE